MRQSSVPIAPLHLGVRVLAARNGWAGPQVELAGVSPVVFWKRLKKSRDWVPRCGELFLKRSAELASAGRLSLPQSSATAIKEPCKTWFLWRVRYCVWLPRLT